MSDDQTRRLGHAQQHPGKTELFNQLKQARKEFGLSTSALTLMWRLLTISRDECPRPDRNGRVVIFASTEFLADRMGMVSASTVTRAINRLEDAGLVRRRSSPNGKRYAVRGSDRSIIDAFGIDIAPFFEKADEIQAACTRVSQEQAEIQRAKQSLRIALTDAKTVPTELEETARKLLRRVSCLDKITQLLARLSNQNTEQTDKLLASDTQNDRHIETLKEQSPTTPDPEQIETTFTALSAELRTSRTLSEVKTRMDRVAVSLGLAKTTWASIVGTHDLTTCFVLLGYLQRNQHTVNHPKAYIRRLSDKLHAGEITLSALVAAAQKMSPADYRPITSEPTAALNFT